MGHLSIALYPLGPAPQPEKQRSAQGHQVTGRAYGRASAVKSRPMRECIRVHTELCVYVSTMGVVLMECLCVLCVGVYMHRHGGMCIVSIYVCSI